MIDNLLDVPIFENSDEDIHCVQAVLQMILKYYFPTQSYSLEYLDGITRHFPGGWTWDTAMLSFLLDLSFEIRFMSRFDFVKFASMGEAYLHTIWDTEQIRLQKLNANLVLEQELARDFWLAQHSCFSYENKKATIEEIKKLFKEGFLVVPNVNAYALDNEVGSCGHYVLITGFDNEQVAFNDVDRPATKNRAIQWSRFDRARQDLASLFAIRPSSKFVRSVS